MLEFRDRVLADHEEESVYFDGTPPVLARVECRSCRQKWPCDAYLLVHADVAALHSARPGLTFVLPADFTAGEAKEVILAAAASPDKGEPR